MAGTGLVGDKGAEAAWLIAQHSPDRQFMAECLEHLRAAVAPRDGGRQCAWRQSVERWIVHCFAIGNWRNQKSREALVLSIGQAHRTDWPIDDPDREPRVVTGDDDAASRTFDLPVLEVPAYTEHGLRGIVPVRRDPREKPGDLWPSRR